MSYPDAIVVVIAETTLQQSLAFTLEAEGYAVKAFDSWQDAETFIPDALCTIIDEDIVREERKAEKGLLCFADKIVLLVEHTSSRDRTVGTALSKPLTGTDVIAAVASFHIIKKAQDKAPIRT